MAALPLNLTPDPPASTHNRVATPPLPTHPLVRSRSLESLVVKPKRVEDQRRRRSLPTIITFQSPANPPMTVARAGRSHHRNDSTASQHPRMRILYHDEVLCRRSQENVFRLLRIVQHDGAATTPNAALETKRDCMSVLLAKKALRYRKMLRRAELVDLDDPSFDIANFVGVRWCKVDGPADDVSMPLPRMRRPTNRWTRPTSTQRA